LEDTDVPCFLTACTCQNRKLEDAVEELSELVRRNRRSLDAAQRTLLGGLQL
jgi:hypothetical protein